MFKTAIVVAAILGATQLYAGFGVAESASAVSSIAEARTAQIEAALQ